MDTAARPIFTLFASALPSFAPCQLLAPGKELGSATTTSAILGYNRRAERVVAMPAHDPGCVKTPKGRSRRGIVIYRRRGFRVVLQPLVTTLVLEKKVILSVLHALAF